MTSQEKAIPTLSQRLCRLRGSSHPILGRASDGCMYVVKSANNPHGANVLFNECAGNVLYRALGLQTSCWTPILAPTSFFSSEEEAPAHDAQAENEVCFASRYLGEQYRIYEILSASLFGKIQNRESFWLAWIVDVCAKHTDNRQAIFVKMPSGYKAVFIDNGDMLGGPNSTSAPHPVASQYLDNRIYYDLTENKVRSMLTKISNLDLDAIWKKVLSTSAAWQSTSGLTQFFSTLDHLGDRAFMRKVTDDIQCIHKGNQTLANARKKPQSIRPADATYSKFRRACARA